MTNRRPLITQDGDNGEDFNYASEHGETAWIGLPNGTALAISHKDDCTFVRLWEDPDDEYPIQEFYYDPSEKLGTQ